MRNLGPVNQHPPSMDDCKPKKRLMQGHRHNFLTQLPVHSSMIPD